MDIKSTKKQHLTREDLAMAKKEKVKSETEYLLIIAQNNPISKIA